MSKNIQVFRVLSGLDKFNCNNINFVDECIVLIRELQSKYPDLICSMTTPICEKHPTAYRTPTQVFFQLNKHISISINEYGNKYGEYHLQLIIGRRSYYNWKVINLGDIGMSISHNGYIMRRNHILKLAIEPNLEETYYRLRNNENIIDTNRLEPMNQHMVDCGSRSTKSYADIARITTFPK